jgi:hypothetical protein
MFKKNKFTIDQNTLTIYPYSDRFAILIVFAIFYVLLSVLILFLIQNYAKFNTFWLVVSGFPTIFILILGVIISNLCIVFDGNKKTVLKKILGIQTQSYTFDELHEIVPVISNMQGMYYKITSIKDKYGKGMRISRAYRSVNHKDAVEFQEQVLTKIQEMLSASTPSSVTNPASIYNFNYYSIEDFVYRLKTSKQLLFWAIIVLAGTIYFNIKSPFDFNTNPPVGEYLARAFGFLFPPIASFMATRKIEFDPNTQIIRNIYAFNTFKQEFAFADFLRFQITRSRYNGIYSDTKVSLVFNSGKMLELKSFYRTKKIQDFVDETDAILKAKT